MTLDGIPLNGADGAPVDLGSLPLGPVARVALYRGLSPALVGQSAIGGVVALETRAPRGHWLEVEAGGGSFATREARAAWAWGGADGGVLAAVDYGGTAGDFTYRNDGGTAWTTADDRDVARGNAASDQVNALVSGAVRLGDRVRLRLLDLATRSDRGLPGVALHETRRSRLALTRNLLGARLDARLPRADLALGASLAWSRTELSDPDAEIGLTAAETRDESLVPAAIAGARARLLDGPVFGLTATATAAWRYERWTPDRRGEAPPAATRHVASLAAGIEAEEAALDTVISGSLRWEGEPGGADGWSFRLAAARELGPGSRVELSVARAVRLPSLYELHGDTGYVVGNDTLSPERAVALELAVHHELDLGPGDLAAVEAAVFSRWVDDLIQYVQNAQNVARAENVARARVTGVEVGAWGDVLAHLRLRGSLTWLDTEDTSAIAARRGEPLPYRPRWKGYARGEGYWRTGDAAVSEVAVYADVEVLGASTLDPAGLVSVPGRALVGVGARARFASDALRLDVSARNVADARAQDLAGFPLPGLTLMASLAWTPPLEAP
ncbi:MAG: TonB-dependent receptor [Deltaproteobacteria bacterium]|nr:TonB-dependent receptor [Deltaproteobacteria bacterium]